MTGKLQRYLAAVWYGTASGAWLRPLGAIYCALMTLRRRCYAAGPCSQARLAAPVWVVGNVTVGGTGKSPLVIWLAETAQKEGFRPGIVTRGYGGTANRQGCTVTPESDVSECGDEPVMLAQRTGVPVRVDADRVRGGRHLVENAGCDLIISDDGLQHLRLARDTEIVVVDADRGFGNRRCLPAGPLREPLKRLDEVDWVVWNGRRAHGYCMELRPGALQALRARGELQAPAPGACVHGVAALGNPERFFGTLRSAGYQVIEHPFPDHYRFRPRDLRFGDERPVIMTDKDAVKCRGFAQPDWWVLPVTAQPADDLKRALTDALRRARDARPD